MMQIELKVSLCYTLAVWYMVLLIVTAIVLVLHNIVIMYYFMDLVVLYEDLTYKSHQCHLHSGLLDEGITWNSLKLNKHDIQYTMCFTHYRLPFVFLRFLLTIKLPSFYHPSILYVYWKISRYKMVHLVDKLFKDARLVTIK